MGFTTLFYVATSIPAKGEDGEVVKGSVQFRDLMRNDEVLKIYEDSVEPFWVSCALCLICVDQDARRELNMNSPVQHVDLVIKCRIIV